MDSTDGRIAFVPMVPDPSFWEVELASILDRVPKYIVRILDGLGDRHPDGRIILTRHGLEAFRRLAISTPARDGIPSHAHTKKRIQQAIESA